MRILLVTPGMPFPPIWGFNIRVFQMIRFLAAHHSVSLLCYGPARSEEENIAREALAGICTEIITVPQQPTVRAQKRRLQARAAIGLASFHMRRLFSSQMQLKLNQLLARRSFDLVQVESSPMASFDFGEVPVVLDEHNIEFELIRRGKEVERDPFRRAFADLESRKVEREEIAIWRKVAGCVLTSRREQELVKTRVRKLATTVVPNGVALDYFRPVEATRKPGSIVFTALMTYRPNVDGLGYFVRDILPNIRRVRPDATVTAVGWGFADDLRPLMGNGVSHTGRVEDVRPYIGGADVVVAPLRIGSGTRLKVLEALAMAKPVVSTTVGCEGLDVEHGEHLLIADDPTSFAQAVVRLLQDPDLGRALGQRGRALVERRYGWEQSAAELERFNESVLGSRRHDLDAAFAAANR